MLCVTILSSVCARCEESDTDLARIALPGCVKEAYIRAPPLPIYYEVPSYAVAVRCLVLTQANVLQAAEQALAEVGGSFSHVKVDRPTSSRCNVRYSPKC